MLLIDSQPEKCSYYILKILVNLSLSVLVKKTVLIKKNSVAHFMIDWVTFGLSEGERLVCTVCVIGNRTRKLTRRYQCQTK